MFDCRKVRIVHQNPFVALHFIAFENSVMPQIKSKQTNQQRKLGFIKQLKRFNYKKIYNKPIELITFWIAKFDLVPAVMAITSRNKLNAEKKSLCDNNTLIRYSMSLDYKVAAQTSNERLIKEKYAVFIDQYFNHHPDFKTNHIVHYFKAEQYYPQKVISSIGLL